MTNFEIEELYIKICLIEKQVTEVKDTLKWHMKIFGRSEKKETPAVIVHEIDEFEKYFGVNAQ